MALPTSAKGDKRFRGHEDDVDSWEWIEERAAIMEVDGGLNREQANYQAFLYWFRRFVEPGSGR